MWQGNILSDKRQGYFLDLTGDMGIKTICDMQQGYFWLLFLATMTGVLKKNDTGFGDPTPIKGLFHEQCY